MTENNRSTSDENNSAFNIPLRDDIDGTSSQGPFNPALKTGIEQGKPKLIDLITKKDIIVGASWLIGVSIVGATYIAVVEYRIFALDSTSKAIVQEQKKFSDFKENSGIELSRLSGELTAVKKNASENEDKLKVLSDTLTEHRIEAAKGISPAKIKNTKTESK